ncbi:MAG: phosphoenolpyruvate-utilizing N-terminal domain-containing protein, partial [bacterium]
MFTLHATGVGGGIAIGPARIIRRARRETPEFAVADAQIDAEVARLEQSIERARAALRKLRDGLAADAPAEVGELLGMHLVMLDDPSLRAARMPVMIRPLDLGAAKQVDGERASDAIRVNPALGRRALRL